MHLFLRCFRLLAILLIGGWYLLINPVSARPPGRSQHRADSSQRRLPVSFGVRLGVNPSNTNFNQGFPPPASPVATTWQLGFTGGLLMNLRLSERIAVQQEYLFVQVGGRVDELGIRYTMRYFSLPLRVQYRPLPWLGLYAGPQFDLLLDARQTDQGVEESIIHTTESRNFGLSGGVLIRLRPRLNLEAGVMQGLNHIGLRQSNRTKEFKWQSAQLSLSYLF